MFSQGYWGERTILILQLRKKGSIFSEYRKCRGCAYGGYPCTLPREFGFPELLCHAMLRYLLAHCQTNNVFFKFADMLFCFHSVDL